MSSSAPLSGVRQAVRRVRGRLAQSAPPPPAPRPPAVVGIVEEFTRRRIVGWVSVPRDAPPTQVSLFLGPLKVTSTYATPDVAMSGWGGHARGGQFVGSAEDFSGDDQEPDQASEPESVPGRARPIPGPADDRRNSGQQIRMFSFRIRGIWPYVGKDTKIFVRVGDRNLPIANHGMFLTPPKKGRLGLAKLRELFDQGYVLTQNGRVELSKKLDVEWQTQVMALYNRTRELVWDGFGHDVFFIYGTLLGVVREGGFIGHDIDFDAAYVSRHRTGPEAAAELQAIALHLVASGLEVLCLPSTLHIHDPADPEHRIDLFHTFFDEDGILRFPFGIAGTTTMRESDWQGCEEIDFAGGKGLVPVRAEQMVEHLYGADWRQPKPGFNWNLDRTDAAVDGQVPTALCTQVYWASFYSRTSYHSGSTFFEYVNGRDDTPATIIDIGCGDGRDGCAFGVAGRRVLGLDQSQVGIEHATAQAAELGVADRARFRVCDVADVESLGAALDEPRDGADEPMMFYLRFFLHAISEDVQDRLLGAIDAHARPGDYFAAEFRTDKDEANAHVHTQHYRRFQNAAEFSDALSSRFGFTVLHEEEGTGLSPYKDEDPVLYRVVARRAESRS